MLGSSSSVAHRATLLMRGNLVRSSSKQRKSSDRRIWAAAAAAAGSGGILALYDSSMRTPLSSPAASSDHPSWTSEETEGTAAIKLLLCSTTTLVASLLLVQQHERRPASSSVVRCEEQEDREEPLLPFVENGEDANDEDTGYAEAERFFQCLDYHRSLLFDYHRRWGPLEALSESSANDNDNKGKNIAGKETSNASSSHSAWPRRIPTEQEINSLETDLKFCLRCPDHKHMSRCPDLQFRIASYYATRPDNDPVSQRKGFKQIKELAVQGHPDSMCYYGILQNEGKIAGVESNPQQAVVWWRRCVDYHRHIIATYELATANYLGEGTPEDPEVAVKLYRRAAHLGHAGAAYMLGECLLDGVGVERDRENALEWLVTAAELGHVLARKRVFAVLDEDYENLDAGQAHEQRIQEEAEKWINLRDEQKVKKVNIERRFSIGGGSRNPKVMARRQTKVKESRDETLA